LPVSPTSEEKNDKSNSSEEGNNLSGLIMSDGLVGNVFNGGSKLNQLVERVRQNA
jgi:hypothetical protein